LYFSHLTYHTQATPAWSMWAGTTPGAGQVLAIVGSPSAALRLPPLPRARGEGAAVAIAMRTYVCDLSVGRSDHVG